MYVKVPTDIFLKVADQNEAEEAAQAIDTGLRHQIEDNFPHGEIIGVEVGGCFDVAEAEVADRGFTEE